MLWAISAISALAHKRRWPEEVQLLTISALLDDERSVSVFGIQAQTGVVGEVGYKTMHFRQVGDKFTLPDGNTAPLLSEREKSEIEMLLAPLIKQVGLTGNPTCGAPGVGFGLRVYFAIFTTIANWRPELAVSLMDIIDAPVGSIRRRISLLREAAGILLARHSPTDRQTQ